MTIEITVEPEYIRLKEISPRGHWYIKYYSLDTKFEFNNREYIARVNNLIVKPVMEFSDD